VLTAGGSDTTGARDALAKLCQTYWYPLYADVRRRGSIGRHIDNPVALTYQL
jgi:hypothetical protein